MRKFIDNPILNLVVRIFLAVVFIYYGTTKIADPALFAEKIGNYDMLPSLIINLMAVTIPWIEIVVGILLIFGIRQRENALIAGSLLTVFTIAVAVAFARGLDISCGCSGPDAEQVVGWKKILENMGLILLSLFLTMSHNKKLSFSG